MLSELPKGAKTALTIAIGGGTIYYPGMVQWDTTSKELIVGDQSCGGIYTASAFTLFRLQTRPERSRVRLTCRTREAGKSAILIQGVIYKGKLAGSDNDICGSSPSTTYVWPYPAGGAPTLRIARRTPRRWARR